MPPQSSPDEHRWYSPADCAALLLGTAHGSRNSYRAPCPAHDGDNPQSLHIWLATDPRGYDVTRLYCHAHQCDIRDICAAMGIALHNLYSARPAYSQMMRHFPAAHSPRIAQLKTIEEPTSDEIAQVMLEEMIATDVSDPPWIQTCVPARQKMWALAQGSPERRVALTNALKTARLNPARFWSQLASDMRGYGLHG